MFLGLMFVRSKSLALSVVFPTDQGNDVGGKWVGVVVLPALPKFLAEREFVAGSRLLWPGSLGCHATEHRLLRV